MKRYQFLTGLTVLILFFILTSAVSTFAKPYYKGKTVQILVPHAPGGGTDIFARLVAKHLSQYIPGKPTMIVRTMLGAMTMTCANYVYNTAKKDGLTVMAGSGASAMHSFLQTKGAKFKYDDMPIVLVGPQGETVYTRAKLCPKREDIVKVGKNLVFGCAPVPWSVTVSFMLTKHLFRFETKRDVLAYESAESRRAFLAGEIDLAVESSVGFAKAVYPYVKKGEVLPLWQSGLYNPENQLVRQAGALADVPTVKEVYEKIYGKAPSGPEWKALSAYIAYDRGINKAIFLPPRTEKYAAILREAAVKMAKDPAFKKEANKIFLGAPVYTGEEAMKAMKNASASAEASRAWLKKWLHKGWGVEFEK
jgi:tripartite-type tricarboxylate transporter receptor subunit TctC